MKKSAFWCLLLICCSCIAFMGGFYVGRNFSRAAVQVEVLPLATQSGEQQLVNINTATLEQLQTLPKIGPVLAQRILDYRDANGPFANVTDIANVEGIGGTIFEAISAYITVGG